MSRERVSIWIFMKYISEVGCIGYSGYTVGCSGYTISLIYPIFVFSMAWWKKSYIAAFVQKLTNRTKDLLFYRWCYEGAKNWSKCLISVLFQMVLDFGFTCRWVCRIELSEYWGGVLWWSSCSEKRYRFGVVLGANPTIFGKVNVGCVGHMEQMGFGRPFSRWYADGKKRARP